MNNTEHLELLILGTKEGEAKNLLLELYNYLDTLSDSEYKDLIDGIKAGLITDLYPINTRV